MNRILAIFIWLAATATSVLFMSGRWWFPPLASAQGVAIDQQFALTFAVIGVAFVMTQIALGFAVWRYGATSDAPAAQSAGNNRLEIFWTAATAFVFIALAVLGQRVWLNLRGEEAPADAVRVEVWGQQFQWYFHYAGADARMGRTRAELISDAGGNPVGLDRASDPLAKDDIVAPTLVLPLNRPTELILHARDVTHSLWLPNLRFKQDAVPGLQVRAILTATAPGLYDVACAELCGQQHYKMKAQLLVLPDADFRALMSLPPDQWPAKRDEFVQRYAASPPP
jgi:cytochrome c oxidase subunit 2